LAQITEELLVDLDMDTVDWSDNFDGSLQEPDVLPARLPNLLLNGANGIAVGMATNIPPHNLSELSAAIAHIIDHYDNLDAVSVEDLMQFVTGPDFPTGASILGGASLREIYATGRGRLIVRAKAEIEEIGKGDRQAIIITEIPYQVNKVAVIERLAQLVKEDKVVEISDLRDESDRNGMRIVIELKRGAQPLKALNKIYKHSQLQTTFAVQVLALVDGEPRTIGLKRALQIYIEHRREVIRRRSEFQLSKARARAHILEGYLKALANLDDVIATIREAADSEAAREALMVLFDLSEAQARAILDLQLRRLASLERQRIEDEYSTVRTQIEYLVDLLASPHKILALIRSDITELSAKYGDERRTLIDYEASGDFNEEDFVRDEEILLSLTQRGFIKRTASALYKAQHRGGRGVTGMTTRDEDVIAHLVSANSLDYLLFFTNKGKVYSLRSYQLPEADRTGKGMLITNLLALEPDEMITAIANVRNFEQGYFVMATRKGKIMRVEVGDFATAINRTGGLKAMQLLEDDVLRWVHWTSGHDSVILATAFGQAVCLPEDTMRVLARGGQGVRSLRLAEGDYIAGVDVVDEKVVELLVLTVKGYGKRTPISEYPPQGRNGKGRRTISKKALEKLGQIISIHSLRPEQEITMITRDGIALRTRADLIRLAGRSTQGVRVMRLNKGDEVVSVAVVEPVPVLVAVDDEGNADLEIEMSADELAGIEEADLADDMPDELAEEIVTDDGDESDDDSPLLDLDDEPDAQGQ
jgi:DNA gyrase subunit A